MPCDLLQAVGDLGKWAGDHLVDPAAIALFVGAALRSSAIAGEVSTHDLRAEEINTDLTRWVNDRGRVLNGEIFRALNLARQGNIEDVVQTPPPPDVGGVPGDQSDSGAFEARVGRIMRQALHEYRDEASSKVREYRAMARAEGWFHRLVRRGRRDDPPSPLVLSPANREILESWRERTIPTHDTPTVTVQDDPSKAEDANDIYPLEDKGLTWASAARRAVSSDH